MKLITVWSKLITFSFKVITVWLKLITVWYKLITVWYKLITVWYFLFEVNYCSVEVNTFRMILIHPTSHTMNIFVWHSFHKEEKEREKVFFISLLFFHFLSLARLCDLFPFMRQSYKRNFVLKKDKNSLKIAVDAHLWIGHSNCSLIRIEVPSGWSKTNIVFFKDKISLIGLPSEHAAYWSKPH